MGTVQRIAHVDETAKRLPSVEVVDSVGNDVLDPGNGAHTHSFAESVVRGAIHVAHPNFAIVLGSKVVHVDVHLVAVGEGGLAMTGSENSPYVLEEDDPLSIPHCAVKCLVAQYSHVRVLTVRS